MRNRPIFIVLLCMLVIPATRSMSQFQYYEVQEQQSALRLAKEQDEAQEKPVSIRSFELEIVTALVDDFLMAGALARLYIFDVDNIRSHLTIRYSVDLRNGNMWFIPYYGVTIPRIGGFEVGVKPRQETVHTVPGWVTWRLFGGDENIFAISADILTNVPIGSIGVYDAGVKFRVLDNGSMMYVGFANYGKNQDEVEIFGPAIKTWWALGDGTSLMLNGSYILKHPDDTYKQFTLSVGWRVAF